jgi:hypothetical protein
MKNIVLKTCLTALALSVACSANAQSAPEEPVKIFTPQLISHAAISGAAISIAADSVIDGNLAAQAAVTIGAGLKSQTQHIYAGAAVTTGALSTVKNIFSGAATGIGASAHAQNVHAGAAITVGAGGDVYEVYAGAAITLGAGAYAYPGALGANANTDSTAPEDIHNATSMAEAIAQMGLAQDALSTLNNSTTNPPESLYTTMGGFVSLEPGVHQGSAVSIAANSIVEFSADNFSDDPMDHVWVINLSEALTVGAGTVFVTDVPEDDTATIIWNVGAAVTLGAGTEFIGTAFVGGAFGAATSNVSCGNIYATGAVSVGSIGALLDGTSDPVACDTNAQGLTAFTVDANEIVVGEAPTSICPAWTAAQLSTGAVYPESMQRGVNDTDGEIFLLEMWTYEGPYSNNIPEENVTKYEWNDYEAFHNTIVDIGYGNDIQTIAAMDMTPEQFARCGEMLLEAMDLAPPESNG